MIYAANGEGTLTVIKQEDTNVYKVQETIPTQKGARTISVNKKLHQVYLPVAEYGERPAATTENSRPRASIKENSFKIIVVD